MKKISCKFLTIITLLFLYSNLTGQINLKDKINTLPVADGNYIVSADKDKTISVIKKKGIIISYSAIDIKGNKLPIEFINAGLSGNPGTSAKPKSPAPKSKTPTKKLPPKPGGGDSPYCEICVTINGQKSCEPVDCATIPAQ